MKKHAVILILCGTTGIAQDASEVALAKATLDALQTRSFAENREYCGYLYRDLDGKLLATPATTGAENYCEPEPPEYEDEVIVASYHTHGAFAYEAPAEFPSVSDIEADEEEGIDGYLTTPGGRFWYVDTTDMIVSQICIIGCVTRDPNFEPGLDGEIALSYTYEELLDLEGNCPSHSGIVRREVVFTPLNPREIGR